MIEKMEKSNSIAEDEKHCMTNCRVPVLKYRSLAGIVRPVRMLLLVLAGLAALGLPASAAQTGYGEARSRKSYRYSCPAPLKFAAGACVKRCPAGYRDTGRYCRFKNMSR